MWNVRTPCKSPLFSSTAAALADVERVAAWWYARHFRRRPRLPRGRVEHPAETQADDLWNTISGRLRATLTESTYDTWFGQARPRSLADEQLVVELPNDFTRDWVEGHFHDVVDRVAREAMTANTVVSFAVAEVAAQLAAGRTGEAPRSTRPNASSRSRTGKPRSSSTRSTPSTSSSSARRTGSPTPRRSPLPRRRLRRTTLSSSTAARVWARPISCRRSATTFASTRVA